MIRLLLLISSGTLLAAADPGRFGGFITRAAEDHGPAGERAARFLVEHMPAADRDALAPSFLTENLNLAFTARTGFPWAAAVPEEIFHNDVLPYAVFDETREAWRPRLLEVARDIVRDCTTATEAAQALNRDLFKRIKVHYHPQRRAPNQSPSESMATGKASCTGLAILLVNACRAVGVPARAAGTPMWTNLRGNHTWVEIWDRGWHFTGADEYDPNGLNRGWFTADAAKADASDPDHAIYATSWRRGPLHFPLVWAPQATTVAAENVTARYAKQSSPAGAELGIRLFERKGGERIAAIVRAADFSGRFHLRAETKAGNADLNDMPRLHAAKGAAGVACFIRGNEVRLRPFGPLKDQPATLDAVWDELPAAPAAISALVRWLELDANTRQREAPLLLEPLTKADVPATAALLAAELFQRDLDARKAELAAKSLELGDKTMRWLEKTFGDAPADGRSLWISMHGGGGTPAPVNDQQWRNQIRLYQPAEGIYLAPRAPTDNWNLWHEPHIDPMFQRLIENHVLFRGVNPDKVYLMGYSAGGDGVWQLAPRMADRFAAAAMMAGHPNEATLDGLHNLPFALFMGGEDAAYERNRIAAERADELGRLAAANPGAYIHLARIYPGVGHWMELRDAEALPWMAKHRRNPWPRRIIWKQDDVTHERFYWLRIPGKEAARTGQRITARVEQQQVIVEGDVPPNTEIRLSDSLLDLDRPVALSVNGTKLPETRVRRSAAVLLRTLGERADLSAAAPAVLTTP
jgi:transglutaminase-like putative cysteine protease